MQAVRIDAMSDQEITPESDRSSEAALADAYRPEEDFDGALPELSSWEEEPVRGPYDGETLQALEWSKVTDYFASLCRTEWGQEYARRLPFAATHTEALRELTQAREAHHFLFERGEALPIQRIQDLRLSFLRLEKGGTLEPSSFLEIAHMLEAAQVLRKFLHDAQDEMPSVWERGELLSPLQALRREIEECVDRDGTLKDDASWELGALRAQVRKCHEGLRRKIQEYLSPPTNRYLTDSYYTIRQERYVLPVKASDQSKIPGIVYGSSATGQTVFVEPHAVVERNNALRIAEHDVANEEARILRKLSRRVAQQIATLRANLELLRDLDLVAARVEMAEALQATIPELLPADEEARLQLKQARHPLLLLKGVEVVANDLLLDASARTLIISGPNTGGKTVALKTMGICALMARAGLPIPADEGSQIPFFGAVFTDIGDRQSLEHDLSTFSAQVVKLRSVLERARRDTLVLIDEIVVGTDPEQGHALATAILEALTDAGAFVAVTTHYPQLKALPHEDERFINACVGFNLERLEPTYRLYLGAPGGSSALSIARRLGLSEELCARAETLLTPEADRFERVVNRLEQQYEELYAERERASKARRQIERERLEIQRQREELERAKERVLSQEETEWRSSMRQARQVLRETTRSLQQQKSADWEVVKQAERQLQQATAQAVEAFEAATPVSERPKAPSADALEVGQKVLVRSLRTQGEVLEVPDGSGQVLVQVGILRTRVPLEDIKAHKKKAAPKAARSVPKARPAPVEAKPEPSSGEFHAIPTSQNQCDLRGMRVDEALDRAEAFLDRALNQELSVAYLIHGHGTGALRKAIRELCKHSPYVRQFRPGERGEGGNGVTAVLLAI